MRWTRLLGTTGTTDKVYHASPGIQRAQSLQSDAYDQRDYQEFVDFLKLGALRAFVAYLLVASRALG